MSFPNEDILSLVVDIGSHTTRAGYAGDDGPKQLWNSCVGCDDDNSVTSDITKLHYPLIFYEKMEGCKVKPCFIFHPNDQKFSIQEDTFEKIIAYTCEGRPSGSISSTTNKNEEHEPLLHFPPRLPVSGLGVNISDFPILLSEPCNPTKQLRQSITEILFEKFDAPAIYLAKRPVLSILSVGRSGGLVVDIGAATLSISPVTEAYLRLEQYLEFPIAGNTLDIQFSHILAENGYPLYPLYAIKKNFHKNKYDIKKVDCTKVHPSYLQYSQFETIRTLKEAMCKVAEDEFFYQSTIKYNGKGNSVFQSYTNMHYNELPDGTQLELEPYAYSVPEILFQPHLIKSENQNLLGQFKGLTSAIFQSISESESEIKKDLISSIILTGGTSNLPGLSDRLSRSLQKASLLTSKARVTHCDRRYSSWVGGSILASLSSFHQLWLSAEEYHEHGSSVSDRKFS